MARTFLVTPKMHPALAARVEASVRGRRLAGERPVGLVAVARFAGAAVVLLLCSAVAFAWHSRQGAREQLRGQLLAAIDAQRQDLSERDHQLPSRAALILRDEAQQHGDVVAGDAGALDALLARPAVYVRLDREAIAGSDTLWRAAKDSVKDAFVMCLFDPPTARDEASLQQTITVAYSGGLEAATAGVRRLHSAAEGLRFLSRDFIERVEQADSLEALGELHSAFDRAPIAAAKQAARAEILIYLIDDPPEAGARVELDGASRHRAQAGIVEIAGSRPLVRLSRMLDPAWISEEGRFQHGRALDACRLALDLRAQVAR